MHGMSQMLSHRWKFEPIRVSLRAITHNTCYSWVWLMAPWRYGWTWLFLVEFTHKVTRLVLEWRSREQVTQNLMTALPGMTFCTQSSALTTELWWGWGWARLPCLVLTCDIQWNPGTTNPIWQRPWYIMNNILQPTNSKMYGKKPRNNEPSL